MNRVSFSYHIRTHNEADRRFACEECLKPFITRAKLRQHMRCHTGEKTFKERERNPLYRIVQKHENPCKICIFVWNFAVQVIISKIQGFFLCPVSVQHLQFTVFTSRQFEAPPEKDPSDPAARLETVQVRDPWDLLIIRMHQLRKIHQIQLPDLRQFKWEIH